MIAYHFVGSELRDGNEIPADGEWLTHNGRIELCASGLHASLSVKDALQYAPGETLCLVRLGGKILHGDDKLVAERRMILARFNADELLREYARWCALQVIELWDAPDVVRSYLETGDESLRDAAEAASRGAPRSTSRDASRAASMAASRAAAWNASRAALWAASGDALWAAGIPSMAAGTAAGDAQEEHLAKRVTAKFLERGFDVEKLRSET